MMTGAKSGANVALPRQGVTSRKCEVILLFLEEGMSLLDLAPKEQRPRLCAVITAVCVLIAVGIGVGLYFAVFSGRGADTGAKGEAASTVGS